MLIIDADLTGKCRDSFLYEWGYERVDKPIHYLVLIAASTIGSAELLVRTDALKRRLPLLGPSGDSWSHPFVAGCLVMNLVECGINDCHSFQLAAFPND